MLRLTSSVFFILINLSFSPAQVYGTQLEELPIEIKLDIASNLNDEKDLSNLILSCKAFSNDSNLLWREFLMSRQIKTNHKKYKPFSSFPKTTGFPTMSDIVSLVIGIEKNIEEAPTLVEGLQTIIRYSSNILSPNNAADILKKKNVELVIAYPSRGNIKVGFKFNRRVPRTPDDTALEFFTDGVRPCFMLMKRFPFQSGEPIENFFNRGLKGNIFLTGLDLSSYLNMENREMGLDCPSFERAISQLCLFLHKKLMPNLEDLSLKECGISNIDACRLATALASNDSLHVINLSANFITDIGAASLEEMIKINSALREMDLSYNHIGDPKQDDLRRSWALTRRNPADLSLEGNLTVPDLTYHYEGLDIL